MHFHAKYADSLRFQIVVNLIDQIKIKAKYNKNKNMKIKITECIVMSMNCFMIIVFKRY